MPEAVAVKRQEAKDLQQKLAEKFGKPDPELTGPGSLFAVTNPYQIIQLGAIGDACSLLTKVEVEAVLGPLSVDPYPSSSNWPPLAHGKGLACAYFTPGHHVFVVAPTWSGGGDNFKREKGIGGMVGLVAPKEGMTVIERPMGRRASRHEWRADVPEG